MARKSTPSIVLKLDTVEGLFFNSTHNAASCRIVEALEQLENSRLAAAYNLLLETISISPRTRLSNQSDTARLFDLSIEAAEDETMWRGSIRKVNVSSVDLRLSNLKCEVMSIKHHIVDCLPLSDHQD